MNNNIRPEFVDNQSGNTLANAINNYLKWLSEHLANPTKLSIATGYFNPEGYFEIADQLEKLDKVQLLLGTEPTPPQFNTKRNPGELTDETFVKQLVDDSLKALAEGMEHDRNLLGFSQEIDDKLKRLIEFLETDKIEVRLYEKRFLHGKAFIFADTEGLISGSSNFTYAGLTTNMELNLGRYDPTPVANVQNWFNDLWEDANEFDLASIYNVRYKEYEPYLIYLKVLWELYKSELESEEKETGRIPLTNFQNEGISRAESIMDKYNGVLIADGVGLGKTFIGGELIRKTVEEQRQRAILICPAALRDSTWHRFKQLNQIYMETVSYEQFTSHIDHLVTDGKKGSLSPKIAKLSDYSLVVIDEAQAFRNPGIDRAFALRKLLQGSPPKKLVLMSATPVNNSIWDIYWLLSYFIKQDAAFFHKGIMSFRNRIAEAQGLDPTALKPDHLFDILDEVTVRRTRNFVKKYFPNDKIKGPGGKEITIQFPKPHVTRIEYDLESMMPGLLSDFEEKIMPENGEPELTLARYFPNKFHKCKDKDLEPGLVALMRSMLLKRLESSPYAFAKTLKKIIGNHQTFLDGIQNGVILTTQDIHEYQETDNDESADLFSENNERESVDDYDIPSLEASVKYDIGILKGFLNLSEPINRNEDTKLESLVSSLKAIANRASDKGIDDKNKRDKRKVVIFSYFADTVDWISDHLNQVIVSDPDLKIYKERIITLGGKNTSKYSREQSIFGFVPESAEAPEGSDKDLFDIMVTTDVLAEGQNLQQCQNIINYDLPWNPMRLVQRHGRIDRIGSPHSDVYIGCVFPDKDLEKLLSLENRIRQKLARAAATIGVESEVIPQGAVGEIVYAKNKQIQALAQEETSLFENAGEDVNAHSGEEYRQELRKGIESNGNLIKQLPGAAGSGFKTTEGEGHFFCCKVGDRLYLRFVPFETDKVVTNTLECLKFISCTDTTTRYISAEMQNGVYDAWDKARNSVFKEWQYLTDPVNFQPKIRPLFRKIAEHLRKYPPKEVNQDRLDQTVDALEAPYSLRIERELRNTFNIADKSPIEISRLIYDKVINLGLEPYEPQDPFPPIDESEVKLVCWMALSKE